MGASRCKSTHQIYHVTSTGGGAYAGTRPAHSSASMRLQVGLRLRIQEAPRSWALKHWRPGPPAPRNTSAGLACTSCQRMRPEKACLDRVRSFGGIGDTLALEQRVECHARHRAKWPCRSFHWWHSRFSTCPVLSSPPPGRTSSPHAPCASHTGTSSAPIASTQRQAFHRVVPGGATSYRPRHQQRARRAGCREHMELAGGIGVHSPLLLRYALVGYISQEAQAQRTLEGEGVSDLGSRGEAVAPTAKVTAFTHEDTNPL